MLVLGAHRRKGFPCTEQTGFLVRKSHQERHAQCALADPRSQILPWDRALGSGGVGLRALPPWAHAGSVCLGPLAPWVGRPPCCPQLCSTRSCCGHCGWHGDHGPPHRGREPRGGRDGDLLEPGVFHCAHVPLGHEVPGEVLRPPLGQQLSGACEPPHLCCPSLSCFWLAPSCGQWLLQAGLCAGDLPVLCLSWGAPPADSASSSS